MLAGLIDKPIETWTDEQSERCRSKWEAYLSENNNQAQIEPIEYFFPRRVNFSGNDRTHLGGAQGTYTYGRIFIKCKYKEDGTLNQ